VNDVLDGTCVGIDLVAGRWWVAPPATAARLLHAAADLADTPSASPAATAAFLGSLQWLHLLRRPLLAGLGASYTFAREATDWSRSVMPRSVRAELVGGAVLGLFWEVDMWQPFLPLVGATDASLEFGHGAAVAPLPVEEVEALARLAHKTGEHVVLEGTQLPEEAETRSKRLGRRHRLRLGLSDFEVLFSKRMHHPQHINLEEERALIRYLQWLLRSPGRFGRRTVVLIDSRVVLGGTIKGRSGSPQLNALLRQVAALVLAGNLGMHMVYIPSAHNPADPPSRGGRSTWPRALREGSRYGVAGGPRWRRRAIRHSQATEAKLEKTLAPLSARLRALRRAAEVLRRLDRSPAPSEQSSAQSSESFVGSSCPDSLC